MADVLARLQGEDAAESFEVKADKRRGQSDLGERVAAASITDMIGYGMAAGILVCIPLVLAMRPHNEVQPQPRVLPSVVSARVGIAPAIPKVEPTHVGVPSAPDEEKSQAIARVDLPDHPDPGPPEELAGDGVTIAVKTPTPPVPPVVPAPRATVGMAAIMDGVRRTASSTRWQSTGLPDPRLVRAIDAALGEVRAATGERSYVLPVRFGRVPPGLEVNPNRVIHVASRNPPAHILSDIQFPNRLEAGRAVAAILIVDGDVVLTSADDCLIAATGTVEVSYPTRCVIFAGRGIRASHDTASVLVAGSKVVVSHAYAGPRAPRHPAVYSGPDLVQVSHAADVIFLNSTTRKVSHQSGCRPLDWPALDFGDTR